MKTETLIGYELRALQLEALEYQELLLRHARLRASVRVLMRVWSAVSDFVLPVIHARKDQAERVVDAVQQLFTVMVRKRALRLVGLSSSTFHERIAQIKFKCGVSPLDRCFKRHPQQLATREVQRIKQLYEDPGFPCWPGSSLYFEGLQARGLHIAQSTFYKYVKLLGLTRPRITPPRKTVGLRATKPNEFLHIDTSFWKVDEGKAAVVFVSDNFSKAILGSQAAPTKHAVHVVEALREAIGTIRKYHPQDVSATLVADGGSENHNELVDGFLVSVPVPLITMITALKDIAFSNSPIEAINKIFKQYLRHYNPNTLAGVQRVKDLFIHDYGARRPHGSLKGLRPMERYINPALIPDHRKQIQQARTIRIQENLAINCAQCLMPMNS